VKFIIDNMWLIVLVLVSGGALALPGLQRRGSKVSLLQATQFINQGKTLILDVRKPAEFAAGHVLDARNVPLNELSKRAGELDKFKNRTVIVVCANGVQSPRAVAQLKKAGFGDVYSLTGGIAAWQAQGLPTAK
jgi:rhodanese-related sulfurtransferase